MRMSRISSRGRLPKIRKISALRLALLTTLTGLLVMFAFSGCSLLHKEQAGGPLSHEINEQEDVVYSHGYTIKNLDRLDEFMERRSGSLRLIQYTPEGGPIYKELRYKGGKLVIAYDTTEDDFGPKETGTFVCTALNREDESTVLKYTLTGCEGEYPETALLWIGFELSEMDDFGFVLKYGVNLRNEINTIQEKLVKDLQDGSVAEADHFKLSHGQLQKIFRELVLANYMHDKTLTGSCNIKPSVSYELQIDINNHELQFAWSECDQSADGKEMTALARYIIGMVQEEKLYKELPDIRGYYE
ncbi:hypothetical protein PAECIP111892_02615 [Paenibacillus auburnensis]|uniref:DUF4362 domain-containing protein n=1 Tax=Paenibacillus auburnensis TaxID=2905649 RepID=A0ABN8GFM8_9BACL|nr:DUF4362 domain-containing protein [Paenibacillus auburnensis]CAH1205041.1 hypothetical protein PAECIP111892_02615 [Paenibacillus auburnensis]